MNLAQIRLITRDNLSAGKGINQQFGEDPWWDDNEINYYVKEAQDHVARAIRRAVADYFLDIMKSTDAVVRIGYENYNPALLKITANQSLYQLPPDFLSLKLFRALPGSSQVVRFTMSDISKEEFRVLFSQTAAESVREFLLDILANRTMIVGPTPGTSFDTELFYIRRLLPLREYKIGTVSVTNGSAVVTGVGTLFLNHVCPGAELMVGTATLDPTINAHEIYPKIKSVDSDTQLTLEAPYAETTVSGAKYLISDVSEIPDDYHSLLVTYATMEGFRKGLGADAGAVQLWASKLNVQLPDLVSDIERRQQSDPEFTQAYLEDVYEGYFY